MTAEHIRTLLRAAGCPTEPAEVGVSMAQLRESYTLARTIRSRYSVLDLVNEAGILEACVDELFTPGGYWAALAHP
jgi:glycerol-1-phosphate dehydrogenase [NAD(P)+]